MIIKLDRFFLDEKDIFVIVFWLFVICAGIFHIPVYPFRFASLVVVLIFLTFSRTLISQMKFTSYFFIILGGLIFSLFLSPYAVALYLGIALLLYVKTNLI